MDGLISLLIFIIIVAIIFAVIAYIIDLVLAQLAPTATPYSGWIKLALLLLALLLILRKAWPMLGV